MSAHRTALHIFRRSLDARKKPDLRWVYTVDVTLRSGEGAVLRRCRSAKITREVPYVYHIPRCTAAERPVVVGFGPAGMFAALVLAKAGLQPLVLERGDPAPLRREKVERFWSGGPLDPESNVQFGEGGAGAFSDGKLNTGTKNERGRWVLLQFVRFGAQEEILYDAKPHVGTDVLFHVIQNLREEVLRLGGEVRFGARLTGLETQDGRITGVRWIEDGAERSFACRDVILAIGHSARDTFRWLHAAGIPMQPKPFAMGVRIEHPQAVIDRAQYGKPRGELPPADYKLAVHLPDGGAAYTFCMCPGGHVVAAASQPGGVVTNGMSYAARGGENANSALLASVTPEDFPEPGPLGGMLWQEQIEQACFRLGGADYHAPAQLLGDFLAHRPSAAEGGIRPTYRPGVRLCDLHDALPKKLTDTLEQAMPRLAGLLPGFDAPDALLTAPETRSSSPVRIVRGEDCQSELRGLYPCGEGAGYAGGILSAAVDGLRRGRAAPNGGQDMTQEFPNQTSSPLWTSESVRLEKLAWRQELGRRAIVRSRMNRVCLMLLIWLAVFSQLSSTGVVLLSFLQLDIPAWLTGAGRLAAACGTVGLVLIWKRRPFWQNVMFARSGRPRAGEVLLWVLCLLALQGAAGLLQSLLSPAMEFFRTKSKVVSGTAETSVSLALYTAVAAPVTEELLFRGAVLRSLQPYGKRFAIFCSALLFGLVHQNLTQTPFAFGFGLLAGYVAMEYSILWSMSLHILNNAVLALGLDALLRPLSGTWYWLAIRGVLFLLPLAVCLVLALVFRKKLAARRERDPIDPKWRRLFFRTPGWIIFLVLSCVCIILNFFVLGA